jgi:hypothetical protein
MLPGESDADGNAPDGLPNQVGVLLKAAVEQSPNLNVYLSKWNGAVVAAPGCLLSSAQVTLIIFRSVFKTMMSRMVPFGLVIKAALVFATRIG